MKKYYLFLTIAILLLTACGRQSPDEDYAVDADEYYNITYDITYEAELDDPPADTYIPAEEPAPVFESDIDFVMVALLFARTEAIWDTDDGALWGVPLHVPLIIACSLTRVGVASQPLWEGLVQYPTDDMIVYVGMLPCDAWIGTTIVTIDGQDAGMMTWCIMEFFDFDEQSMVSVLVHEGFHIVQRRIHGHTGFGSIINGHTEGAQNSYILEVTALLQAWQTTGQEQLANINDALYIRNARRLTYLTQEENQLEIGEGLVQYTESVLVRSHEEIEEFLVYLIDRMKHMEIIEASGVALSWGYISGKLYGLLLDELCTVWRTGPIHRDTDLGQLLQEAAGLDNLTPPTDLERFGYSQIAAATRHRMAEFEGKMLAALEALAQPHIRIPVVEGYGVVRDGIFIVPKYRVEEKGLDINRDPNMRTTLDPFLLTSGIVECRWGRLYLESGHTHVQWGRNYWLSAPSFEIVRNRVYGEGWMIELNDGWELDVLGNGNGRIRRR